MRSGDKHVQNKLAEHASRLEVKLNQANVMLSNLQDDQGSALVNNVDSTQGKRAALQQFNPEIVPTVASIGKEDLHPKKSPPKNKPVAEASMPRTVVGISKVENEPKSAAQKGKVENDSDSGSESEDKHRGDGSGREDSDGADSVSRDSRGGSEEDSDEEDSDDEGGSQHEYSSSSS